MANNLAIIKTDIAKMQGEFGKALPSYIPAERFVRTAQTAVAFTRNIDRVTDTKSLLAEVTKAAQDGLVLDGREAALVIDSQGRAQYRPMMRGLLKLAHNSGALKGLVVEIARKGDTFKHRPTNLVEPVIHEIDHEGERGEPFVVYAVASLEHGGIIHEVMNVADINRIRDRSDGYRAFKAGKIKATPWSTDWAEMARKTVFRRISKYLPSSSDRDRFHEAVERIDADYSFEAEADKEGNVSNPRPAQNKKRGGAAAALKNVTPAQEQPARRDEPEADSTTLDYDLNTGEVYDHDETPRPGEDF